MVQLLLILLLYASFRLSILYIQRHRKRKSRRWTFIITWTEVGIITGICLMYWIRVFYSWLAIPVLGILFGAYAYHRTLKWSPDDTDKEDWEQQIDEIGKG